MCARPQRGSRSLPQLGVFTVAQTERADQQVDGVGARILPLAALECADSLTRQSGALGQQFLSQTPCAAIALEECGERRLRLGFHRAAATISRPTYPR
jgi:hypothetical protein